MSEDNVLKFKSKFKSVISMISLPDNPRFENIVPVSHVFHIFQTQQGTRIALQIIPSVVTIDVHWVCVALCVLLGVAKDLNFIFFNCLSVQLWLLSSFRVLPGHDSSLHFARHVHRYKLTFNQLLICQT